jgi:translation initiation factor 2-alpha kinase 4
MLGKGGFGTVMMIKDQLEDVYYAVKKVRLHLPSSGDFGENVRNHRVFREVTALSKSSYQEMKHVVRYYNSWLEDLSTQERSLEQKKI